VSVALLTSGAAYADRVLLALGMAGVEVDAVLVVDARPRGRGGWRRAASATAKRPRTVAAAAAGRARSMLEGGGAQRWAGLAREVHRVGPLNGEEMLGRLRALAPDHLLLASVGIVGAEALGAVRLATLNAHPALLPWAPGLGVVERSLQRAVPVGASVHLVDAGVDTGAIVRRELVPALPLDTLGSLRAKAQERAALLLAQVVAEAPPREPPAAVAQPERWPACDWPPREEVARLEAEIRGGLAVRLYAEWSAFYGGMELPAAEVRSPAVVG